MIYWLKPEFNTLLTQSILQSDSDTGRRRKRRRRRRRRVVQLIEGPPTCQHAADSSSSSSVALYLLGSSEWWHLREITAPDTELVSTVNMNEMKIAVLGGEGVGKSGRRAGTHVTEHKSDKLVSFNGPHLTNCLYLSVSMYLSVCLSGPVCPSKLVFLSLTVCLSVPVCICLQLSSSGSSPGVLLASTHLPQVIN